MLVGSNNSLTYLEPSSPWFKVFKYIWRCQTIDFKRQYTNGGVRLFDIKLSVDSYNHIIVKNGIFSYSVFSLYDVFDFLNKQGDVIVHISFNVNGDECCDNRYYSMERKFMEYCKIIETIYDDIRFYGGERLFDGKVIYTFEKETLNPKPLVFNVANYSFAYRIASIISPRLTRKMNKKYKEKYWKLHGFLLLNHVGD